MLVPKLFDLANKRIFVAGHRGMVGAAIVARLAQVECTILTASRAQLDLTRQAEVEKWMGAERPHVVVVAAARVGGIVANTTYPAEFIGENLCIATNVIKAAHDHGVSKLLFLGSTCIYPQRAPQPIPESALLTGPLEPTNEWYAVAKIAGIKMCQAYRRQYGDDFIALMPTNLFGPGDNYHRDDSHVIPALLRRFHEAKKNAIGKVSVWGTGKPRREFLHVADLADACIYALGHYSSEQVLNVGSGRDIRIRDLAKVIARVVGYKGQIVFESDKPDGVARKLVDVSMMRTLGWSAKIGLEEGLASTYRHMLEGHGRNIRDLVGAESW